MPQLKNTEILGTILKSTLGVISRRTSEAYANMVIDTVISNLANNYYFLKKIRIEKDRFKEIVNVIDLDDEIDKVKIEIVGKSIKDFMISIASLMGKDAGFYFIKEIKEDLPYEYENKIKELGVDLDYIQSEFITEVKSSFKFGIKNSEVFKHVITVLFEIIESEYGRNAAYENLAELTSRLRTQYDCLNYVKINDVRSIQNVDIVQVDKKVDDLDCRDIGATIQKIIQEISINFDGRKVLSFMDKLKNNISADYNFKLRDIGVNFDVIKLKQTFLIKKVIRSLLEILSESSAESYAVLALNNILKMYSEKFDFLDQIKIDSLHLSDGMDAIKVPNEINTVSPSELGRSIQKIIEKVSTSLGEEAGRNFLNRLKQRMGKAYILRMEEIGVNLHMIELRRNLL